MSSTPWQGLVDMRRLTGRCECGATEYEVADEFGYAMNCHCSNCRAGTGSAFKAFAASSARSSR
jgi:hypothetical protein